MEKHKFIGYINGLALCKTKEYGLGFRERQDVGRIGLISNAKA